MEDQEAQAKYSQAVYQLLADTPQSKILNIDGTDVLVSQPDDYMFYRLWCAVEDGVIDQTEFAVQLVQICVPGKLNKKMAFKLLVKDGFAQKPPKSEILDTIMNFKNVQEFIELGKSAEAGNSKEADADF